jgi:hypothetical protein
MVKVLVILQEMEGKLVPLESINNSDLLVDSACNTIGEYYSEPYGEGDVIGILSTKLYWIV